LTSGALISGLTICAEGLIWIFFLFEEDDDEEDEDEELPFLSPSLTSGAFI
jgi:hypothetical protein